MGTMMLGKLKHIQHSLALLRVRLLYKCLKDNCPGIDHIMVQMIQAGCEILYSKTRKLINSIWNTGELPDQWKQPIIVTIYKKGDKTD
jgi:hypothetical protein